MYFRLVIFLVLNFAALGIGGLFTGKGVPSEWYQGLNKAPWTPPGWVFGVAWTTIMICFAFYMTYAWEHVGNKSQLILLFAFQWVLNVMWNPIFFKFHATTPGLIVISALTLLLILLFFNYLGSMKLKSAWIAPYILWLIVATSLNAYIVLKN